MKDKFIKKLETVDFQHRECLMKKFRNLNLAISDYTFANVYLFRQISNYQFLQADCGLFICGKNKQEQSYVMPLNDLRSCDMKIFNELLDKYGFFYPIPEGWLNFFPESKFTVVSDESESDYIYLTEKMASFAGKTFTRHRNHLNQFFSLYEPQNRLLCAENSSDALEILKQWQNEARLTPGKTDFDQCEEALLKFSELALWGTIYYIENEPAGFIIGEPLNTETFVLHFAKASKKYHGIYEFMFNDTAKKLTADYKYLNLEEDAGNKNLRRTKMSYGPVMLLKKYRVSRKI
ncbi:MAG: phosphatidylglycerol lysyltransferase domain-containing protein [Smithellaceae bacterium]